MYICISIVSIVSSVSNHISIVSSVSILIRVVSSVSILIRVVSSVSICTSIVNSVCDNGIKMKKKLFLLASSLWSSGRGVHYFDFLNFFLFFENISVLTIMYTVYISWLWLPM